MLKTGTLILARLGSLPPSGSLRRRRILQVVGDYTNNILMIIALPSVKYSGRVETDVLAGARRVARQPFAKITIDPEPCMTMLLEKLQKSGRSLEDCCLCLQHIFKDEPRLLRMSGETRWAARNTQAYRSSVPSVNSAHISTFTAPTQTLLTCQL